MLFVILSIKKEKGKLRYEFGFNIVTAYYHKSPSTGLETGVLKTNNDNMKLER